MSSRGLFLVILSALFTVIANLMMRGGIERAGGVVYTPGRLMTLFLHPLVALGFALYGAAALVWFRVIATEPLSTCYPILVSLTFVLLTLGAIVFFEERVTLQKLLGLTVILAGVVMVVRA